ncbi:hypothetical protein QR680_015531 [Steinernema hermaphroditum]|uniref:Metalloendopeptidase n=1 Tax=Steinernema hermaphroditum TaxID=289476 RepID=A0AA39LL16_9BILA|nr:hypothetical protein QR680_015531 [Steinernema hermaphroditum]
MGPHSSLLLLAEIVVVAVLISADPPLTALHEPQKGSNPVLGVVPLSLNEVHEIASKLPDWPKGLQAKLDDLVKNLPKAADGTPLKGKELLKQTGSKLFSKDGQDTSDLDELAKIIAENKGKAEQDLKASEDEVYNKNKEAIDKAKEQGKSLGVKPLPEDAPLSIDQINNALNLSEIFLEHDISRSVADTKKHLGIDEPGKSPKKRQAYYDSQYPDTIWSNGVYYNFDPSLGSNARNVINSAINFWAKNTCIQFKQVDPTNSSSYPVIMFIPGQGCYSPVGRQVGSQYQYVSIGSYCEYIATAAHEIGHSLGLFHEQNRFDRGSSVFVDTTNIQSGHASEYQQQTTSTNYNYGKPYDYQGIMHYRQGVWALNASAPVMYAMDPNYQMSMGWTQLPVFGDIVELNMHYSCYDMCKNTSLVCQYEGYPNPTTNCTTCQCPSGFGGKDCSQRQGASGGANCGATLSAFPDWQTLGVANTVGSGSYTTGALTNPARCTWHITAPVGSKIQYMFTYVGFDNTNNALCYESCYYGGVNVKGSGPSWKPEGMRVCCPYQFNVTMTTTADRLIVQPWNLYRYTDFQLQYRIGMASYELF